MTTEQKASSLSPVRSERHVREPRWDVVSCLFSFVYVRLGSLVFNQCSYAGHERQRYSANYYPES